VRGVLGLSTGLSHGFGGDGHATTLVGSLRHHGMP
jgi:hypothetical protein